MRSPLKLRSALRSFRVETLEPRVVLSADPLAALGPPDFFLHDLAEQIQPPLAWHGPLETPISHQTEGLAGAGPGVAHPTLAVTPHLSDIHDIYGVTAVRNDYGFRGTGQTVAVIDSGVAWDHLALGAGFGEGHRVVGGWDFTEENDANPYDDGPAGFHGTHVAGIIGSDNATYQGVAPGVDLVALRVFNDQGAGYFDWVENALDWVHEHRNDFANPITVVNLSLGVNGFNADAVPDWAMLEDEFAQLEQDGIFISVSAGNSFEDVGQHVGLSYPAVSEYVVPVASVTNGGVFSYFSQRHDRVIAAPGQSITSAVPDHTFGADGYANDFGTASGTSMAAPYVAGASVLVREAMEFAGYTNIDQDMIYDHLRNTADIFYDTVTQASYHRLDLEAAINALMPSDDYGSTVATAHDLGALHGGAAISGAIGALSDVDYFTFSAAGNGEVTFTLSGTHGLDAEWEVVGDGAVNSDVLTLSVTAGQTYTLGLSTGAGIGHYEIAVDADYDAIDLGLASFLEYADQAVSGEQWYRVTATSDGTLTALAAFDAAGGDVDVAWHGADGALLSTGVDLASGNRADAMAAAGQSYLLWVSGANGDVDFTLANLVGGEGAVIEVIGTAGADQMSVNFGGTVSVSVNGLAYQFSAGSVEAIHFQGGAGHDSITLTGGSGSETARLSGEVASLTGAGITATAAGFETVTFVGGAGHDAAYLDGSAGDDRLYVNDAGATLYRPDGAIRAVGFEYTWVNANQGGHDSAYLYGTAGDDRFYLNESGATLYRPDGATRAIGFEYTWANAAQGGHDSAYLYGTSGDDRFYFSNSGATLVHPNSYTRAIGFEHTWADAYQGGHDSAYLYGTSGNDRLYVNEFGATLYHPASFTRAVGFEYTLADANQGGHDSAYLYGTSGDDRLYVNASGASLYHPVSTTRAVGFEYTWANADQGGHDSAYLYGTAGDDRFYLDESGSALVHPHAYTRALGFEYTWANADQGGRDSAYLSGTAGNDRFYLNETGATVFHPKSLTRAIGFEDTHAISGQGGYDTAFLTLVNDDELFAGGDRAEVIGAAYRFLVTGMDEVEAMADASAAPNAEVSATDYLFRLLGNWS